MTRIQSHTGQVQLLSSSLSDVLLWEACVIFGPGFPRALLFCYHRPLLGMGGHAPPYSSMGSEGPQTESGWFFFQKVLYKLVTGSRNEDSHGNSMKIVLWFLGQPVKPGRRQSF